MNEQSSEVKRAHALKCTVDAAIKESLALPMTDPRAVVVGMRAGIMCKHTANPQDICIKCMAALLTNWDYLKVLRAPESLGTA